MWARVYAEPTAWSRRALAVLLLCLVAVGARAETEHNPLEPPDLSSPRATLRTFLDTMNEALRAFDKDQDRDGARERVAFAARALDMTRTAPAVAGVVAFESSLRLKEILDRLPLPPLSAIPDADAMKDVEPARWVVPHTEIAIERVKEGPGAGDYLFSADTVARSGDFYERVRGLPYTRGGTGAHYERYARGTGNFLEAWVDELPGWTRIVIYRQALWQWIGLLVCLVFGAGMVGLVYVAGIAMLAAIDKRRDTRMGAGVGPYILPLALMCVSVAVEWAARELHLTGRVQSATGMLTSTLFFVGGVRAAVVAMDQVASAIISAARLRPRGVDSQLVHLAFRLVMVLVVAFLVVQASDQLGLPVYSILTGLGIGGLAVALAARDTLANLFGSIMLMVDRPFRVGDWVKIGDDEGTVEDIGFRSTRIRTFYNSVLSVPSSHMVNASIDNMGMRRYRRVRTVVQITYDTPPGKIEAFVEGIKEIIRAHAHTRKDYFHVVLNDFGEHSLDLLLYFFLKAPDWSHELVDRQDVLLQIVRLAESMEVRFAFPTRTLHVETLPTA